MRAILFCLSLLIVPIAYGQEPDCYRVAPEAAKVIAEARKDRCEVSCRGCGCKGGSGYRERNGRKQCVSWEALIQT